MLLDVLLLGDDVSRFDEEGEASVGSSEGGLARQLEGWALIAVTRSLQKARSPGSPETDCSSSLQQTRRRSMTFKAWTEPISIRPEGEGRLLLLLLLPLLPPWWLLLPPLLLPLLLLPKGLEEPACWFGKRLLLPPLPEGVLGRSPPKPFRRLLTALMLLFCWDDDDGKDGNPPDASGLEAATW